MYKVTYRIKGSSTEHFKVFANLHVANQFAAELGYYLISVEPYNE
jgi:hypothetical protein